MVFLSQKRNLLSLIRIALSLKTCPTVMVKNAITVSEGLEAES